VQEWEGGKGGGVKMKGRGGDGMGPSGGTFYELGKGGFLKREKKKKEEGEKEDAKNTIGGRLGKTRGQIQYCGGGKGGTKVLPPGKNQRNFSKKSHNMKKMKREKGGGRKDGGTPGWDPGGGQEWDKEGHLGGKKRRGGKSGP